MIVRRRHPRLVVDVGEDLEAEVGVLVEHLEPLRCVVAAMAFDELAVGQQALEAHAHLLAAVRAGIALQRGAAIRDELVEVVRHAAAPSGERVGRRFLRICAWRARPVIASEAKGFGPPTPSS